MRRPGLLIAGAFLAAGAGLAIAAPASASPGTSGGTAVVAGSSHSSDWYWDDNDDCWYGIYGGYNYYRPWYGVGRPWGYGGYGGGYGIGVGVGIGF